MEYAIETINRILKENGMSQAEADHLLAKLLEEETIPYLESMCELNESDNETDRLINILSLVGLDKKDITILLLHFLDENAQDYLDAPEIEEQTLEDIFNGRFLDKQKNYS